MILRPYGLVIGGRLELGLEIEVVGNTIASIRPHTGMPDPFVISPAFVNAHSHLEYAGFQGKVLETRWWPWIREITRLKQEQQQSEVAESALGGALENYFGGVGFIGEHSDRPVANKSISMSGMEGVVFQEVITFYEGASPDEKLRLVAERAESQRLDAASPVFLNPHSVYTVDRSTLASFGASQDPISLHFAESRDESAFTRDGGGPIGEFYRQFGVPFEPTGKSVYWTAKDLGLVRRNAQLVHCCDLSEVEIEDLATTGATVAHCPRSNAALSCPTAKVREMLEAGVTVGLGMDSAASSGPIDMFEEMRAALHCSAERGAPLTGEQVWRMATAGGAESLGREGWRLEAGSSVPLIQIAVEGAHQVDDLIAQGSPKEVSWIEGPMF